MATRQIALGEARASALIATALGVLVAIALLPTSFAFADNGSSLDAGITAITAVSTQEADSGSVAVKKAPGQSSGSWQDVWTAEGASQTGVLPAGMSFNASTKTLSLSNFAGESYAVYASGGGALSINVSGTNALRYVKADGCSLSIVGIGTLRLGGQAQVSASPLTVSGKGDNVAKLSVGLGVALNLVPVSANGRSMDLSYTLYEDDNDWAYFDSITGSQVSSASQLFSIGGTYSSSAVKTTGPLDRSVSPYSVYFADEAHKVRVKMLECVRTESDDDDDSDEERTYVSSEYAVGQDSQTYYRINTWATDASTGEVAYLATRIDSLPQGNGVEMRIPSGQAVERDVYTDYTQSNKEGNQAFAYMEKDGKAYLRAIATEATDSSFITRVRYSYYELGIESGSLRNWVSICIHGIEPKVVEFEQGPATAIPTTELPELPSNVYDIASGQKDAYGYTYVTHPYHEYRAYVAGEFTVQAKSQGSTEKEDADKSPEETPGSNRSGSAGNNDMTSGNSQLSSNGDSSSSVGAAVGATAKSGGATYKVTSNASGKKAAVSFAKAPKSKKSAKVPATVKLGGKTYQVTGIAKGAFKGTKAKTVTVKSKKLTKKGVKGCFKGSKVTTVKVPKSKLKAYKKIFTKANCGKKVKVVAI